MKRRHLLVSGATGLALPALLGHAALAQPAWPDRPIRLIVPFPPGGGTDTVARELATRIGAATGWTIVADNRPGAGGTIGLDVVAKAPPDGYTIGLGQTSNLAIAPAIYPNLPFDPLRDLTPIGLVAQQPNIIVVARNSPIRDLAGLLAAARARPGQLSAGHPGNGTVGHLGGEVMNASAGIEIVQVPYRGAGTVIADLLAGRIDVYSANPLSVKGVLEAGEVRALAVTSPARSSAFPDVPTVAELGHPAFEAMNWTGLVGPARLPEPILNRINEEMRKVLANADLRARFTNEGSDVVGSTPAEFRQYLEAEINKWGTLIRSANLRVN